MGIDSLKDNDINRLSEKISEISRKVEETRDPEALDAIRKLIRSSVPFTRRMYFAAMLLKESLDNEKAKTEHKVPERPHQKRVQDKKPQANNLKEEGRPFEKRREKPHVEAPEGCETLYMNIGRDSFTKEEIMKLFENEVGLQKNDIINLSIYRWFCFTIMTKENAEKAIEKINGREIKGRTVTARIAKPKD